MTRPLPLGAIGPHRLNGAIACGISDIGPVRKSNEDNFLIDDELGLLAVADGMGGHLAGAEASAGALEALRQFLAASDGSADAVVSSDPDATWSDPAMHAIGRLHDAVDFANKRLYAQNRARQMSDGSGMGTTLTGVWRPQANGPLLMFHVGDSRLYRYRADELELLTRDQTWYQQALEAGKIDDLPARNLLLQAVGPSTLVKPEIRSQIVLPGDLLMLCSDGLHGCVPHQELVNVLQDLDELIYRRVETAVEDALAHACRRLVALAKDYGGRDNITVMLALCDA